MPLDTQLFCLHKSEWAAVNLCGNACSAVSVKAKRLPLFSFVNPAAGHRACVDVQIYVIPPLCPSLLVFACVSVFMSELWSVALQSLHKADAWNKWIISFMRSLLLKVGHWPKALAFFSSLSLFFQLSYWQLHLNKEINIHSFSLSCFFLQARILCISQSLMDITNHSPNWLFYIFFLSPLTKSRLDEGRPLWLSGCL